MIVHGVYRGSKFCANRSPPKWKIPKFRISRVFDINRMLRRNFLIAGHYLMALCSNKMACKYMRLGYGSW